MQAGALVHPFQNREEVFTQQENASFARCDGDTCSKNDKSWNDHISGVARVSVSTQSAITA